MMVRILKKIFGRAASTANVIYGQAQKIHKLLRAYGQDVRFYVFGHAHQATILPLLPESNIPCYLNTGTWTKNLAHAANHEDFTFVEITRDVHNKKQARLLRWHDVECTASEYIEESQ
jgi:hypothetical protein